MNKDDFKQEILDSFRRTNARSNHIIFLNQFRFGILLKSNPEEQKMFMEAANELISEGYLKYEPGEGGLDLIRLTDKGFDEIYKNSQDDCEIAKLLMREFQKNNLKVGGVILMQSIRISLFSTLNPVEQDRFVDVANRLIQGKYISYEDGSAGNIECLKLLQKGYETIYYDSYSNLEKIFT